MQRESTRLPKSSFHRRSQAFIVAYMVEEIGIPESAANTLVSYHNCISLAEALELFLLDDGGFYAHLFIPKESDSSSCIVCDSPQPAHQFKDSQAVKFIEDERQSSDYFEGSGRESFEERRETCQICYIEYILGDLVHIEGVMHPVCLQCMNAYIKEEINNMRVQGLKCAHCPVKLSMELIREYVDNITFNKYKMFMRNAEVQKNPNLKWCPNPKCSVVIMTNRKKKTTKCPKCGTEICNKCNREAHAGNSCDAVFEKEIKSWENSSDIQKCKKCRGMVQKISGCNHMTCAICGHEWCWLCGGTYSSAHFNSLNPFGCPGLQNRQKEDWGKCKIISWRVMLLLGFLILTPILLPIAMLICGPAFVGNYFWSECRPYTCLKKVVFALISLIFGLALSPIFWIGVIIYFTPKGIQYCLEYFRRRRRQNQRSEDLIKQKLIEDAENLYSENEVLN